MWPSFHDFLSTAQSWFSSPLAIEIVKSLLSMAGIGIGGFIAIFTYFKQKEYELVKQRYLEGAIDVLVAHFLSMNTEVSNNYARCLQVLRSYSQSGEFFEAKELDTGFLPPKEFSFEETAHVRLQNLIGSDAFWTAFQFATAQFQAANTLLVFEIPQALRIKLSSPEKLNVDKEELADKSAELARARHDDLFKYAPIASGLHTIATILEQQKLSFKAILKVRKLPAVMEVIRKIEEINSAEVERLDGKKDARIASRKKS